MANTPHLRQIRKARPRLLRGSRVVVALAFASGGCSPSRSSPLPDTNVARYLEDGIFRRAALEASLVNRENGYARVRLAHYDSGDEQDWGRLPEWNPDSEVITALELDQPNGASALTVTTAARPLLLPGKVEAVDDPALVALGREAFARYPTQLAAYMSAALTSRAAAERYGLWVDPARGVGGMVRARMADGSGALALTCATCHAVGGAGEISDGPTNDRLDIGAAILDAATAPIDDAVAGALARWGPGRVDVTTTAGTEPARIPDLRPIRFQTHLHQDATLVARDRTTLAIRIETLIITSHGQTLRPPRIVALALAAYLISLAAALPPVQNAEQASPRGATLFTESCASCHVPPGFTGPPVELAVIGTEPTLGRSAERGTGSYRVPSLRGVGARTPLLHDASLSSLEALFDAARVSETFTGGRLGPGAVPGHEFALGLSVSDRAALLEFLAAL